MGGMGREVLALAEIRAGAAVLAEETASLPYHPCVLTLDGWWRGEEGPVHGECEARSPARTPHASRNRRAMPRRATWRPCPGTPSSWT
ncbi:hypothetical protein OTB20_19870 [Streptomyces sp. H27-H1]|uniref:hypothetical protein n=1 Tax=Streptomyces sp. H27-H1 TaxID=2996461 RepID=UPI00226D50E4|nr:hypothetical protein [Streptomyces sp. H27-H1]MCY0928416.1 hypothetical protein [Streptomyces sp. H27-H1]